MASKYEDRLRMRLYRKYSKDEEVSFLVDQMKKLEYENGVLKSDLAEARDHAKIKSRNLGLEKRKAEDRLQEKNIKIKELQQRLNDFKNEVMKDEKIKELVSKLKIKSKDFRILQERHLSLKVKYEKL